jgi:CubicO group peptidase (beta-lactamase class C family)
MSLRVIATVLISFLSSLSAPGYGNDSSLQGNKDPANARINTVSKYQDIKALIEEAIDDSSQPFSGSVIVLENGTPVLELQKGAGMTKDSSFVMGSLSKQITATLILQAVEVGKPDLSHSLNR